MMTRLFIPPIALVSESIFARFLDLHHQEATVSLTRLNEKLKEADPTRPKKPDISPSEIALQELRRWMKETGDLLNRQSKIDIFGTNKSNLWKIRSV